MSGPTPPPRGVAVRLFALSLAALCAACGDGGGAAPPPDCGDTCAATRDVAPDRGGRPDGVVDAAPPADGTARDVAGPDAADARAGADASARDGIATDAPAVLDAFDAGPCRDACPAPSAYDCDGARLRTCVIAPTGCLAWSEAAPCPGGRPCEMAVCDAERGCLLAANDCEDGDPCTVSDGCDETEGCRQVPAPYGTPCGDGGQCADGRCEPWVGRCDGVACPPLDGYGATCNAARHCEYFPSDAPAWRRFDRPIWVPREPFRMGSEGDAPTEEQPRHDLRFRDGFFVGRHEVTASEYVAFLGRAGDTSCPDTAACLDGDAPEGTVAWDADAGIAWSRADCADRPGTWPDGDCGDHPAVEVPWAGAAAYCAWMGGRLCAEAEWERAATGGAYPWGDAPPAEAEANCAEEACRDGYRATAPVGDFPGDTSPVGGADFGGNVAEWVADDWHGDYDGAPADGGAWVDAPRAERRVVRGGSCRDAADRLRAAARRGHAAAGSVPSLGFRCCWPSPCAGDDPCAPLAWDGAEGLCAGAPDACDDGDPCTRDACIAGDGCRHEPRDCDDGDACTTDACDPTVGCIHHDRRCDDGDACTRDDCDPASGCRHELLDCDDGDACTDDACHALLGCTYTPVSCTANQPCLRATECDPSTGCATAPLADGTPCENGVCRAGRCEWVGTCAEEPCPPLVGFVGACNAADHCEYAPDGVDGWRSSHRPIWVPAGTFPMGAPVSEGDPDAVPEHPVTFRDGYWIDATEVTAAAYASFLEVGGDERCAASQAACVRSAAYATVAWDPETGSPEVQTTCSVEPFGPTDASCAEHPAVGATFVGATAYCESVGARLCSEAEWERAAKGPGQRRYPWGDEEPTASHANLSGSADGYSGFAPVGRFPAGDSPVGCHDLAGNATEWTADDWHDDYAGAPRDGRPWDDVGLASKVVRAGPETTARWRTSGDAGFRCCWDPSCPVPRLAGPFCDRCRDPWRAGPTCEECLVLACGGACCPPREGYDVLCNAAAHCEYHPRVGTLGAALVWISAGAFLMGAPDEEEAAGSDERPQHEITFARGYFVGRDEGTAAAFAAFLTDRGDDTCGEEPCMDPAEPGERQTVVWDEATALAAPADSCAIEPGGEPASSCAEHPAIRVTLSGARAFCAWQGLRLCGEAEWERAATGTTHRVYPWGSEAPGPDLANCRESSFFSTPGCADGWEETAPVGSFPGGAAPSGCLDMAGNASEWVRSHGSHDEASADGNAEGEASGSGSGITRGGGLNLLPRDLRTAARTGPEGLLLQPWPVVGVRCCLGPPCFDGDPCTRDDFGTVGYECVHEPVDCDDGDRCTIDACGVDGHCVHEPVDCDDSDACSVDECDWQEGCTHVAIDCDDGDACSVDACEPASGCTQTPIDCSDGDPCTGEACDPAVGCVPGPDPCDDGDACTSDTCDAVTGCAHAPVACFDGDPCTSDRCESELGCVFAADVCDDGDACTSDSCDASGVCSHVPIDCTPRDPCYVDVGCEPSSGCLWDALSDGSPCGVDAQCQGGACVWTGRCGTLCPHLDGCDVHCNDTNHCEYALREAFGWRAAERLIWVPPGPFRMGAADDLGESRERPLHEVTFDVGYWVDRYEATAAAFAEFLTARGDVDCDGVPCAETEDGDAVFRWDPVRGEASVREHCQQTTTGLLGDCSRHPAGGVSWSGAAAYCAWRGRRLCTEAEWERAGRGTDDRLFPWGDDGPTSTQANCWDEVCGDGFGAQAPVGSFPVGRSPVGCDDLAGNVEEWVEDGYHSDYEGTPTDGTAWIAEGQTTHVLRGGHATLTDVRVTVRRSGGAGSLHEGFGVRCCRSPDIATPTAAACAAAGRCESVSPAGEAGCEQAARDCDDGDPCTLDGCRATTGCERPATCDDGNPCTLDGCDETSGACDHADAGDGTPCGLGATCEAGTCVWSGRCGGNACPALDGFAAVRCNARDACEYEREGDAADVVVWVPPGAFTLGAMGWDQHLVTFDAGYWIHRDEVSTAAFAAFLDARAGNDCSGVPCANVSGAHLSWDEAAAQAAIHEACEASHASGPDSSCGDHPMVDVTWYGALAWCEAAGLRLCSEAEWEYAARSDDGRRYPWGEYFWTLAVNGKDGDGFQWTAPIGAARPWSASPFGCRAMAGNVSEWVEDDFHRDLADAPLDGSAWIDDPRDDVRVTRGGSWADFLSSLWTSSRGGRTATSSDLTLGFRCCAGLQ